GVRASSTGTSRTSPDGVDSGWWAYGMASWRAKTANSVLIPTPISATCGSDATGTVRERGMPLLSAQWIVTPATPRAARSSASCCASVMAPVRSSDHPSGEGSAPGEQPLHQLDRRLLGVGDVLRHEHGVLVTAVG